MLTLYAPIVVVVTVGVNAAGEAVLPVVVVIPGPLQVYTADPEPPATVAVSVSLAPLQILMSDAPTVTDG